MVFEVRVIIKPDLHIENDFPVADFTEKSITDTKQEFFEKLRTGLSEMSDEKLLGCLTSKHFIIHKKED